MDDFNIDLLRDDQVTGSFVEIANPYGFSLPDFEPTHICH